jgi:hypothetical protein
MLSSALAVALTITALSLTGAMSVAAPPRQEPAEATPPAYASSPRLQGVGTGLAPRLIDRLLSEDAATGPDPAWLRDATGSPGPGDASAAGIDLAKRIDLRLEAGPLLAPLGPGRRTDHGDFTLRLPIADALELRPGAHRDDESWPADPLPTLGIQVPD